MCLSERLAQVRAGVQAACAAAARPADSVRLVAVSKKQPLAAVVAAYDAGVRDFGENTAQELQQKATALAASGRQARWHFVGRLQSNKAAAVAPLAACVHSIDRLSLLGPLSKHAAATRLDVLIQVNVGREAQKGGVNPEAMLDLAAAIATHPQLRLRGLMAVPPQQREARPYFELMSKLFLQLRGMPYGEDVTELSMGMSGDYPLAIACGATMVRVGSAIFGDRRRPEESA